MLSPTVAEISIFALFALGAVVGVLGGFFGVGGGWIITPALNILGMPMPFAVGTGLAYIMGMSSVSAWRHRRRGHLRVKLGLAIGAAMFLGIKIGEQFVTILDRRGQADSVIRALYIVLLLGLGIYMLVHTCKACAGNDPADGGESNGDDSCHDAPLRRWTLKPLIELGQPGAAISLWPVLGIGLATGVLTGVLGVGGGFILMPIMIYLIGLSTIAAVGTSLLCILLASPFGVLVYALAGRVEFAAAGLMVVGALLGAPIGVMASHKVHGSKLRVLYALMIIFGGLSVLLKELDEAFPQRHFGTASVSVIFTAAGGMALLIIVLMLVANVTTRGERTAGP